MTEPLAELRPRYAELSETSGLFLDPAAEALRMSLLQQLWREHMLAQSMLDARLYVFPSPGAEGFMSNNTMLFAMYRMGFHGRATVHGFRAVASTLLNEMGFHPDWIERQLARRT